MLQSIENISSFVQCKSLNVWSVYFYCNTLSRQSYFSRGHGGVQNSSGNSGGVGWGNHFSGPKMEIPRRRGGLTWNSLRGGGMDIFWNYTFCSLDGKESLFDWQITWHVMYQMMIRSFENNKLSLPLHRVVGRFLSSRSHPKSRRLFPFYFSNITLRTDLLTFGVTGAIFKIAGEMRRLPAYFDNPVFMSN